MSQIVEVFPNSDLRSGHPGLTRLALKHKRNPEALGTAKWLFFLNRKQTAFKLLGAGGVLVHWRAPENRRVDVAAIRYIPECFDGKSFDFNIAVKHSLREQLGKRWSE